MTTTPTPGDTAPTPGTRPPTVHDAAGGRPTPRIGLDLTVPDAPYERPCDTCGSPFRVRPCEVRKALRRGNRPPRFCSVKCQHDAYNGAGNPKWRGGRIPQVSGYIYVYAPGHPHATRDGYVMEHRLVMEEMLERYLTAEEQVHHRNHVRDDNRPENLELMANVSKHRTRHAYYQDDTCSSCGEPVRRSIAHRRRWPRAFCSRRCAALAASRAAAEKARAS